MKKSISIQVGSFYQLQYAECGIIDIYHKNETQTNTIPNMKNPIISMYIMFSLCPLFQLGFELFLSLNFK